MADSTTTNQGTTTQVAGNTTAGTTAAKAGTVTADDGIVIDKNKSAQQYITEAEVKYIVPPLVREKFPDLIKLIYETESMNGEEREYWMQIMPIMSEDQIVKFRDILVNEKSQLAKLDSEYEQEMKRINTKSPAAQIDEAKMKEKMQQIKTAEKANEQAEDAKADSLLQQLDKL